MTVTTDDPTVHEQAAHEQAGHEQAVDEQAVDEQAAHEQARDGAGWVPVGVARRELAVLTHREVEVLRLVGAGVPDAGIAAELGLAETAAGAHVAGLLRKLGLPDRARAAVLAGGCDLAPPGAGRGA